MAMTGVAVNNLVNKYKTMWHFVGGPQTPRDHRHREDEHNDAHQVDDH